MSNVLIRDVPTDDLEQIRAAASARGVTLQSYLLEAVRAQARFLRRQEALNHMADRLHGRVTVPEEERQRVLEAIEAAHTARAGALADRDGE